MEFVFPSYCYMWGGLDLPEMAEHLSAHGKQRINFWFCLASVHGFCFPSLTVFISAYGLSSFYNSDSLSPIPLVWEWVSGCAVLGCWLGLNQYKFIYSSWQVPFPFRKVHSKTGRKALRGQTTATLNYFIYDIKKQFKTFLKAQTIKPEFIYQVKNKLFSSYKGKGKQLLYR